MAVFEGARAAPMPVGARRGPAPVARRRRAAPVRAQRRNGPVTLVLGVVLTAFLVGLIYLTQTAQAGARQIQVVRLLDEQRALHRELQSLEGTIARWGAEPLVAERASQLGLDRLGGKHYVPSR